MEAGHEAVIVKRGRKTVAVMVPPDMIEALEDMEDIREADRVLADIRAGREKTIPLNPDFSQAAVACEKSASAATHCGGSFGAVLAHLAQG